MGNLNTLNGVMELFGQIGGLGNENCIFFAAKDNTKMVLAGSVTGTALGTVIGGVAGDIADFAVEATAKSMEFNKEMNLDVLNHYMQFLINETESTISIVPVRVKGVISYKFDEMEPVVEAGRVIPKNQIESIVIKKFSLLTQNIKTIKIKLAAGYKLEFVANTSNKFLPYHNENFAKFCERYKNK